MSWLNKGKLSDRLIGSIDWLLQIRIVERWLSGAFHQPATTIREQIENPRERCIVWNECVVGLERERVGTGLKGARRIYRIVDLGDLVR